MFEYPNYFRVVLTVPEEMMEEAVERIGEFVADHYKSPSAVTIEWMRRKKSTIHSKIIILLFIDVFSVTEPSTALVGEL